MAPNSVSNVPQTLVDPLRQKFIDILRDNGIKDEVSEIQWHEPDHLRGEHMAAASVYVHVEFKDPGAKAKNLFVKKFHDNEAHAKWGKMMRIMEKEADFFTKYLPRLREFCKKYRGCQDLLPFFPKCLYGDDEMVVMNNLVLDDTWIMLDKEEGQDLETAKLVLTNLAKFHAASFAYIQKEFGSREKFLEEWETVCVEAFLTAKIPMMDEIFENGIKTCLSILNGHPVEGGDEASQTLMGFAGKTFELAMDILKNRPEDKFYTVNHGDCWNNNMLFKKDPETGKIEDHLFIDMQITRLGSPGLDLGQFLYTSVKPRIRRAYLNQLLRHYYDTSVETLKKLDVKRPWTFEEFLEDYKEKSQFGFLLNLMMMSTMGAMKEIDPKDMTEDKEKLEELWNNAIDTWMSKNQRKAADISVEIVQGVKEYEQLMGKKHP